MRTVLCTLCGGALPLVPLVLPDGSSLEERDETKTRATLPPPRIVVPTNYVPPSRAYLISPQNEHAPRPPIATYRCKEPQAPAKQDLRDLGPRAAYTRSHKYVGHT
jgi:hypothetical protein